MTRPTRHTTTGDRAGADGPLEADGPLPPDRPSPADGSSARVDRPDPGSGGQVDTRTRLLDAAERLFAEQTFQATSLRRITAEAEANLAAVHYHFGSKQELFLAVFRRRIGPINEERLARLAALERRHAPDDPPLEALLTALFEPAVRLRETPGGQHFAAIISRSLWADGDHWKSLQAEFEAVRDAFRPHLCRACPHLSPGALMWRMHFALSGMCLVLCSAERLGELTAGLCDPTDVDATVRQLVRFTAAGLAAPDDAPPTHTDPPSPTQD